MINSPFYFKVMVMRYFIEYKIGGDWTDTYEWYRKEVSLETYERIMNILESEDNE